jgi:hypothetical protein
MNRSVKRRKKPRLELLKRVKQADFSRPFHASFDPEKTDGFGGDFE